MARLKLTPPWVNYYYELNAMFGEDDDIKIVYDEDENIINLYVNRDTKAEALAELLPDEKEFGNVTLKINIIPANSPSNYRFCSCKGLFEKAFIGNPAFVYTKTIEGIFTNPITYVVFANEVVQYYNDNLSDINGMRSTLYQEIAKDLFGERDGVFYCTDLIYRE